MIGWNGHRGGLVTDFASPSPLVRSYVTMFEQLCVSTAGDGHPLLVVTGPGRGEGRTSVAINLGLCGTQLGGRRTLLIDADTELAGLSRALGKNGKPGLSDVLAGNTPWRDCVQAHEHNERLHVLPAGSSTTVVLAACPPDRLSGLVAEWRREFEWIIVDTPPVLCSATASVLGKHGTGAVLVLRSGRTRMEVLSQAAARLKESDIRTLGVVLNRRRFSIPRYAYRRL